MTTQETLDFFHPGHSKWAKTGTRWHDTVREKLPEIPWSDKTEIKAQHLSFYPDITFLMAKDPAWEPGNAFVYMLEHAGELTLLNGTSPPIHALNGDGLLDLNQDTVIDYLRFFTFFVRGEEGPFYIATTLDAPYAPDVLRAGGPGDHAETQEIFANIHQSIRSFGRDQDGNWLVSVTVVYSNAVFISDFIIQPTGMIEMKDDTPVMADLPSKIDAPLQPDRAIAGTLH